MDPGLAEVMTRAVERTGQEPEAWYHGGSHGWAILPSVRSISNCDRAELHPDRGLRVHSK